MRDVDDLIDWDQITDYGPIVLYTRLGLGDQIVAAGLANYLSQKFAHVYWICRERYVPSVTHLMQTVSNVTIVTCPFEHPNTETAGIQFINDLCQQHNAQLFHAQHGWTYKTQLSWMEGTYEQYRLPYQARYDLCPAILPGPRSQKLFQALRPNNKPYVLFHLTSSEKDSYDVDVFQGRPKNIFRNKDILYISPLTNNLFDWFDLLQNADEIHLVPSSIYTLCESMASKIPGFIYYHNIRAFTDIDPHRLIEPFMPVNWTYVNYDTKQYK
jgi:hypothetical protein